MTIDPQTEADVDTVADRAGLRERIAAAIWERQNPGRRWADCEYRWRADAEEDADAVLSVLPPAADRAAEWRAAAVFVEAMNEACDNRRPCESCTTREDVAAELRRVADEERDEQQAQQGGERRVYAWAQTIDTTNGGNTIHLPGIHHGGSGPEETALVVSREDVPVLAAMLAEAQQDGPEAGECRPGVHSMFDFCPGDCGEPVADEPACTCASAGDAFVPAGHYADCPHAAPAAVVAELGKENGS